MKKLSHVLITAILLCAFVFPEISTTKAGSAPARGAAQTTPSFLESEGQAKTDETSDWLIECVDCSKSFIYLTNRSLRLDADGNPHIAYGGDHLYYARHTRTEWQFDTVDESNYSGSYASLSLDIYGYPHISYCGAGELKYAYKDATNWTVQMVDSDVIGCIATSLALDSDRKPHISYKDWDSPSAKLKYAFQDSVGWHYKIVDDEVDDLGEVNILLNKQDQPHIIYRDAYVPVIMHAYQDTTGWHTETVDSQAWFPTNISMVIDVDGNPHISYHYTRAFPDHFELMYAYKDAAGWHVQMVDDEQYIGATFLTLNQNGEPIIYAYHRDYGLVYANRDVEEWDIQTLGYMEGFISMNLDSGGYLHFLTYPVGDLVYTFQDAASWHTQTVDSWGWVVGTTSLSLDDDGNTHISYRYDTGENRGIKYAYQDATGWHLQSLDNSNVDGSSSSLALDKEGHPHICYDDWNTNMIKYTFKDASGWQYQTVDYGRHPSIALDVDGNPHISYIDVFYWGKVEVRYAYRDASGWKINRVEQGATGSGPFLALDSDGFPHLVYVIDGAIRYAYHDINGWNYQTVAESISNTVYSSTSLVLDDQDIPRIAYIWGYEDRHFNESGVIFDGEEIISLEESYFNGLSLAFDSNGKPHLIYSGGTPSDSYGLVYVYKVADNDWRFEIVGDEIDSMSNSLAIDKRGYPNVSYITNSPPDLRYAYIPAYMVILSPSIDYHIDFPGSRVLYSLILHNRGGETDSYSISASGFNWPTTAPASVRPLAGGESTTIDIQVHIPVTATMGMRDTATITVTSQADSSKTSVAEVITLVGKATFLPLVEK
jgi:hypothetical protein